MADQTVLSFHNAAFGYARGPDLFHGLNAVIEAGQVCTILGPNGAGKTTLMRCMTGALKPRSGRVERRTDFGLVPQSLDLLFDFSVRDLVVMGRLRHVPLLGGPRAEDWREVDAALEKVGLAALAERGFTTLSGGEKQLVLLARALAGGTPLIFLDEPMAALDIANQALVLDVLLTLKAGREHTMVLTTHDPQHAALLADKALLMHRDGDCAYGDASALLTEDALSKLYGVPIRRHVCMATGDAVLAPLSAASAMPKISEAAE